MRYLPLLLTLFLSFLAQAQEEEPEAHAGEIFHSVLVPAGGDAYGNTGSAAYSIGQVFYLSYDNADNSVNEGIQQPSLISSEEVPPVTEKTPPGQENSRNLPPVIDVIAYPNPMTEFFIIEIENFKADRYSYQLFDLNGRLITTGSLENHRTKISPNNLQSAMYILKIFRQARNIKSFKIIKR
ncbi:T9SS type A sorting domain-containing protein [Autumnicola psychrophila]|uniref:T9SS type A sorting domain-containing protein n=1 Tax=Autumnicola psychrophila TaxID=3075592 RepID=A0ABU3DQR6_9FLAO|nr:T9SS type A sorting domain-containing protein [Zunongwangia sp. F225]MDT0686044.1 T9SS type A sorting domain-containing protein [Zunongwangia sp. F225]